MCHGREEIPPVAMDCVPDQACAVAGFSVRALPKA